MKKLLLYFVVVCAIFSCAFLASSAYAQQPEFTPKEIKKFVELLSDDNWRARENAQQQLMLIGPPVIPFIEPLKDSPVLEIRLRAREILKYIRIVDADDAAQIDKIIEKYDPQADVDKLRSLIFELRRIENVNYYLVEKMTSVKPEMRDKIASLLSRVEFRLEGRRVDEDVSYSVDVLLSLARDDLVEKQLKLRSLRTLAKIADRNAAATLFEIRENESPKIAEYASRAMESIRDKIRANQGNKAPAQDGIRSWWLKAKNQEDFACSLKHLKLRLEFEEKEANKTAPFLGVVKDESRIDSGGAHVQRPWQDSGAMKGGIKEGDSIIEFDGRPIDRWSDMVYGIRRGHVGQKVILKVLREGKEKELEIVLGERTN